MHLKDAMFLWTPNTSDYDDDLFPLKGILDVKIPPDTRQRPNHPKSDGSCTRAWIEKSDECRRIMLEALIKKFLEEDDLDPSSVYSAISKIDDIEPNDYLIIDQKS